MLGIGRSQSIVPLLWLTFTLPGMVWAKESGSWSLAAPDRPLFTFPRHEPFVESPERENHEPLEAGGRLHLALRQIVSPTRLASTAVTAGLSQRLDSPLQRGYGGGIDGYFKRFGSHYAFWASKDLVGTFALATLLEEDPRYRPSAETRFWKRVGSATASSFVTRSRGQRISFNLSNLGGLAAAAGLANLWHAEEDRGPKETLARFGFGLGVDILVRLVSELTRDSE